MSGHKNAKSLPSTEILNTLLSYDPETGLLTWRERPFIKRAKWWKTMWAGKDALGHISTEGYKVGLVHGVTYAAHRIIWKMVKGEEPHQEIDHINGDRLDNRICNLREVTSRENCRNRAMSSRNTSGHVGVYWSGRHRKWVAQTFERSNGLRQTLTLGYFKKIEDAVAARKMATEGLFSERHGL